LPRHGRPIALSRRGRRRRRQRGQRRGALPLTVCAPLQFTRTALIPGNRCHEPACLPHETVVLIARAGRPAVQHKMPKPVADVVRADLHALVDQEPTA